jgi:hypothetical protein
MGYMLTMPIGAMEVIRIGAASRMLCESTATTRRRAERGELESLRTLDGEYLFYLTDVSALAHRLAAQNPRRPPQVVA